MPTVAPCEALFCWLAIFSDIDTIVSHGGHGATEGFLAVDQGFDAGLLIKLGFAKIKNITQAQIR
jgi:hypothetical protein